MYFKSSPNSADIFLDFFYDTRFQPDGLLESQIRLFDAIEVTLYSGFRDSEFSVYGLPRGAA